MIRAILFDLDDTLYLESDYYRSGFRVVADELQARGVGDAAELRALMESIQDSEGPAGVIDKAARRWPFRSEWVPELVELVRGHIPSISLLKEDRDLLLQLRSRFLLGCVCDGRSQVQRNKIHALGLENMMDSIVYSDDLGRDYWKPHPRPYQTCCKNLGIDAGQCVFVGDSPERDIRGARNAGMLAVRLRRFGSYSFNAPVTTIDNPDYEINELTHLQQIIH